MAMSMKYSNRDQISTLPEEIRQHILSLLPCKEAIKTSILSSNWRYVWLNLPTLSFDKSIFAKKIEFQRIVELVLFKSFLKIETEKLRNFILLFLDFLERINIHRKDREKCMRYTTSQVLDLYLCTLPEFYPRIVSFFKQLEVKELRLTLNFGFLTDEKDTEFLESIGDLQELTSLCLYIGQSGKLTSPLRLPSCLRNLSLDNVDIHVLVLEKLFDSNSCIESLCFNCCSGFTILKVYGLPKLKMLKVTYNKDLIRLEIDVLPSLSSLFYYLTIHQRAKLLVSKSVALKILKLLNYDLQEQFGNSMDNLVLLEMEACKNIHAFNVENCKKLTTLLLDGCQINDECLNKFIETLPSIKHLGIKHCDLLEKLKISRSHLQLLALLGCIKLHRVEINCPNLNRFSHVNFDNLIVLSSMTPFPPTSVNLWLPHRRNHSAEYVNLLELFKSIRNCKKLILGAYYIEVISSLTFKYF
ncbi:F-box protein At5g03100-like [Chenopodium quinoa]|uniref:F-box protein At5g03100-like n=1 Tax=Chenopodium quinoa TaxID=63459 RepID=UPI000B77AF15|nr:F-box protein At5g03100-like [Chenopodium quinoa]